MELIGLYLVAAGLLVGAGVAKAIRPGDTARALGSSPRTRPGADSAAAGRDSTWCRRQRPSSGLAAFAGCPGR